MKTWCHLVADISNLSNQVSLGPAQLGKPKDRGVGRCFLLGPLHTHCKACVIGWCACWMTHRDWMRLLRILIAI